MEKLIEIARAGVGKRLDKESKTLFRNSSWIFVSNFSGIALSLGRAIVIARGLGAETFGSYAIVVAFVGIVQEFLNLNLGTAIIKFGAQYHYDMRIDKLVAFIKASLRITVLMVIISILVITCLTFLSYSVFVHKPELEWFIIFYAMASGSKYFSAISNGILRLYFKFKLNSIIQIIMNVIETSLVIIAVLLYPRNLHVFFLAVIIGCFLSGLISNGMAYWELRNEFKPFLHVKFDLIRDEMKNVKTFVIGNSLGNSLKSLMAQGDVLLLGVLAGPVQVAFYSIAKKISYSILTVTDPFMQSIFPQFSKLLAGKKFMETKRMLGKITMVAALPSVVFIFVTFFLKEWLFTTIFGKEFLESVYPFIYLLLSAVFSSVTFWALPLIVSLGLVRLRIQVYMLAIVVGAVIAYISIPQMKASGMALALLGMNVIINTLFIYFGYRKMKITESIS